MFLIDDIMFLIDEEALWNACKEIAGENYGLLYVDTEEKKDKLIKKYKERVQKSSNVLFKSTFKSTVSYKDLTNFLAKRIKEEKGERLIGLRESIYFIPVVFSEKEIRDKEIENLKKLFEENIVLSAEMIRKEFSIGYDDRLFFVEELANSGLIKALSEGEKEKTTEYYVMGNTFRDIVSTDLFIKTIGRYAEAGLVTHAKLEEAIKVDATNKVIGYLEEEGILVRVNNNRYLVHGMMIKFAWRIANEIKGSIEEKFKECKYVVNEAVVRSVIEDKISERYTVCDPNMKGEIITSVLDQTVQICDLSKYETLLIAQKKMESFIEEKAKEISDKVYETGFLYSKLIDNVDEKVKESYFNPDNKVNNFLKDKIIKKCKEIINKKLTPEEDAQKMFKANNKGGDIDG